MSAPWRSTEDRVSHSFQYLFPELHLHCIICDPCPSLKLLLSGSSPAFSPQKASMWLCWVDMPCPLKWAGDFYNWRGSNFQEITKLFSTDLLPEQRPHTVIFPWVAFPQKWLLGHHDIWSHMDTNLWAEGIFSSPVPFDFTSCYHYWMAALVQFIPVGLSFCFTGAQLMSK